MKKLAFIITLCIITQSVWAKSENPRVKIETNKGTIVIDIYSKVAPKTASNFLQYIRNGFYEGTIFHRVIKGFMIQGGGFTAKMYRKNTRESIINEADNGLKNVRGTIAMARTGQPHSATSQFFINSIDNPFLDHKSKTPSGWGYCVFGKVIEGMDVIDGISSGPTSTLKDHKDVPISPVIIQRVLVIKQ